MGRYISAQALRNAVERLRQSRASRGMVNFLILKRAVNLASDGAVDLSTQDPSFQQAITELTWWPHETDAAEQRPFIDVFGSTNDKNLGTKKKKYRSNGPADTLKNGAWSPVVQISEGTRSRRATLTSNYRSGVEHLVLLKDTQRPKPQLTDAALWYFRSRDVQSIVGKSTVEQEIFTKLAEAFCVELGLVKEDLSVLFGEQDDVNESTG